MTAPDRSPSPSEKGPSLDTGANGSREVAGRVQRELERFYQLEAAPPVVDFLRATEDGERESVRIRDADDGSVEIEVVAPVLHADTGLDGVCQLIEGVSHFLHVADRARRRLPTTHLELELQAEVDKYVVLVLGNPRIDEHLARTVHGRLYERVHFCHPAGTEEGDRYRMANHLAARFVRRLETRYATRDRGRMHRALALFYGMGQAEKIQFARAA